MSVVLRFLCFVFFLVMSNYAQTQQDLVTLVKDALSLHQKGNLDDALDGYDKLVNDLHKLTPAMGATIHSNRGAILLQQGNYELAKDAFLAATNTEPENVNAHYNLAVTLTSKLNEHANAMKHTLVVLKKNPSHVKALHLLGNIMQGLGRPDDASRYYLKAERIAQEEAAATSSNASNDMPINENINGKEKDTTSSTSWYDNFRDASNFNIGDSFSKIHNDRVYTITCLSKIPGIFRISGLLNSTECNSIITKGEPNLEYSYVTGGTKEDTEEYRTSKNAWLPPDGLLLDIQLRLAILLGMSTSEVNDLRMSAEELQVIKYEGGGQFKVHHDSSTFQQRLMTLLIYLNNVNENENEDDKSGGTWFPYAGKNAIPSHDISSVDDANRRALSVYENNHSKSGIIEYPIQGNAILFFNYDSNGEIDHLAVHAGLPVATGHEKQDHEIKKWAANYWFRKTK
jgi:tetratricopeptide (TPR) repeat protein